MRAPYPIIVTVAKMGYNEAKHEQSIYLIYSKMLFLVSFSARYVLIKHKIKSYFAFRDAQTIALIIKERNRILQED
jgi:hypothetical protein